MISKPCIKTMNNKDIKVCSKTSADRLHQRDNAVLNMPKDTAFMLKINKI